MDKTQPTVKTGLALVVQLSYLGMSIFWNPIHVGLIAAGQKPLGAVGSLEMVVVMVVLAIMLVVSVRRLIWLYAAISLLLGLAVVPTRNVIRL